MAEARDDDRRKDSEDQGEPLGVRHPFYLWFGFLGGAAAWAFQLGLVYIIFEVSCNSNRFAGTVLGTPASEFFSLLITVIAATTALSAAIISYLSHPVELARDETHRTGELEAYTRSRFMAYTGMVLSGIFLMAILSNGLAYFFLRSC